MTSGNYRTALGHAVFEINQQTKVSFKWTTNTNYAWKAYSCMFGRTGWEGQAGWQLSNGRTKFASSALNITYLPSSLPLDRLKVVWLHELSHVWGLGHVKGINHVMNESASLAYLRGGVKTLTSDEKNAYKALY